MVSYLKDSLEKSALLSDFSGEIPDIWSFSSNDSFLERSDDPFAELKDVVIDHIDTQNNLSLELSELAKTLVDLKEQFSKSAASGFKIWDSHPELSKKPANAPCPICSALDGMRIPVDDEFPFVGQVTLKDGTAMGRKGPPAHPHCNCKLRYELDNTSIDQETPGLRDTHHEISHDFSSINHEEGQPRPDPNTPGLEDQDFTSFEAPEVEVDVPGTEPQPMEDVLEKVTREEEKSPEEKAEEAEKELDKFYKGLEDNI